VTIPFTERFFPPLPDPRPWDSWGQSLTVAGAGGTPGFTLISYLTDPLPVDSRLDYLVICHEEADSFEWTFTNADTNLKSECSIDANIAWTQVDVSGPLQTRVVVKNGGNTVATLELTQNASNPSPEFEQVKADLSRPEDAQLVFALGEVVQDFRSYIIDAAAATGPNGIPARLLAGVLFNETKDRPKDGSPGAKKIRKALDGQSFNPRLEEIIRQIKGGGRRRVDEMALDLIRDVDLEMIRGFLNEFGDVDLLDWFSALNVLDPRFETSWYAGAKSLGVGQVAQTTAAMTIGLIPWRDINKKARSETLDAIKHDFFGLTLNDLRRIFTSLRFPKSNIALAAQLLAKLKNRAHRFPGLTAKEVLSNPNAIGVIATEYHIGGTDTPLADAGSDIYGDAVNATVNADSGGLTLFYPDPPP
jgi:hypothetical protein